MNWNRSLKALRLLAAVGAIGCAGTVLAGPDSDSKAPAQPGTGKQAPTQAAGTAAGHTTDASREVKKFDPTGGKGYPADADEDVRGAEPHDTCATAPLVLSNSTTVINNTTASDVASDPVQCRIGGGNGSGSVWVRFVATHTTMRVLTCNSVAQDSIISIHQGSCGAFTLVACNDDACGASTFLSSMDVTGLTVGTQYYVMLRAWSAADRGSFTLQLISPLPEATCGNCPPGANPRPEPVCSDGYVDMTNGGCNSVPPVFQNVACGETICGKSGTFLNGATQSRDTDWYKLVLATETSVILEATAEFPLLIGVVNTNGIDDCAGVTAFRVLDTAASCEIATTAATCLPAGTWYIFVAPSAFTGAPCNLNLDYFLTVNCDACAPPPECPCPKGSVPEPIFETESGPEPDCGIPTDIFNGGCNSVPPVFAVAECGVNYAGNSAFDGATRDTDWYRVVIDAPTTVSMTFSAEFSAVIGQIVGDFPLGQPDCALVVGISPFAITDACSEQVLSVNLTTPGEYWFFVGPDFDAGFVACPPDNANYCVRFDCVPSKPPCEITVPPGAIAETDDAGNPTGEPDCGLPVDLLNGGCNSVPPVFSAVECGDVINGTSSFTGSTRDTDWYTLTLGAQTRVTLSVTTEFQGVFGIIAGDFPAGAPDCELVTAINPAAFTLPCVDGAFVTACFEPGTYWFFVGGDFAGDPFPCGADYVATFDCSPCSACSVTCPGGSQLEGEADCGFPVDTVNGGCNSEPPVFGEIACNQTICGTTFNDGATRDTDWFSISIGAATSVTLTVSAEFFGSALIVNDDCANLLLFGFVDFTDNCAGTASGPIPLDPGNYNVVILPDFAAGNETCGADYTLTLAGDCGGGGADCNKNGIPDSQDIAGGTSRDCFDYDFPQTPGGPYKAGGANGIPDECECVADWNRDGIANSTDVGEHINTYFLDQSTLTTIFADVDCNGVSNSADVGEFINTYFAAQANQLPFAGCTI